MHQRTTTRDRRTAAHLVALSVATLLVAACASTEPTAPVHGPGDAASLLAHSTGEPEVVINDEVWIDRTIEEESVPIEGIGDEDGGMMVSAMEAEPRIRVGIYYVDLAVTNIRMGARDDADPYDLHRMTASGPVLVGSGLTGELFATIVGTSVRYARANGTVVVTTSDPVRLTSASGFVRIRRFASDQSLYRGTAEIRFPNAATRNRLVGVNELPIEQYLYGVVPRELGPIAFPFLEAQKTQAIAARTFARRRMQFCPAARCGNGYHTVPTTTDQVYGPYRTSTGGPGEFALSNQAVDETRGVVATSNGALIEALYSSTTGGFTANSEDVFSATLSYLRGVPDHERGQAMDHVPTLDVFRRHGNPTNLRNHANGDFESDWSIYHRWYVDWTKEEMRQVVGRIGSATFIDPGEVYAINVLSRSSSGRVFEMEFVTEKRGTLVARKDAVRSALRYVTYSSTGAMTLNSLRSTLVYIEPVIDPKTKALVGWEAWGGGWGHGLGVSQTGAVGMAEKGRTHQEILAHYYRGVSLEQRW